MHQPMQPKTTIITTIQLFASVLFAGDGLLNTALYLPQIRKTWKIPQGSSLGTWGFWTLTSADGVFYALVCAQNIVLALVMLGNLLGCLSIFLIALVRRSRR